MRGDATTQTVMLLAGTPDRLVPADRPMRRNKPLVDRALAALASTVAALYAATGRPSIPPEHLLKGGLLIALYSVRSERQVCERLQYDRLVEWCRDLHITDPAFDASTFSKDRERRLRHDVAGPCFDAALAEAERHDLLSDDHSRDFVRECRKRQVTPHVARNTRGRRSAIDGRTTRHPGYSISRRRRQRVEAICGWTKTIGGGRKLRYRGLARNQCWADLTTAPSDLVRLVTLMPAARTHDPRAPEAPPMTRTTHDPPRTAPGPCTATRFSAPC